MNENLATTDLAEADLLLIEEHVRHLFTSMGFTTSSIRCQHLAPQLYIHIEAGPDGKLLIGTHGAHLAALQHIVRTIVRATVPAGTRITVDVNGYRARREQDLMAVAETAAQRALSEGQVVTLPPMNSADRRIIHTALANRTDIVTASTGVEPKRAVVIKPVSL
jgi:spoIIIJ-associated protein